MSTKSKTVSASSAVSAASAVSASSAAEYVCSGDNGKMLNAIRQFCYQYLPHIGWGDVVVTTNTTITNNDVLRTTIGSMFIPVDGVFDSAEHSRDVFTEYLISNYNNIILGHPSVATTKENDATFDATNATFDDSFVAADRDDSTKTVRANDIERKSIPKLLMYCDITHPANATNMFRPLTTDDCTFILNGESVESPYRYPMEICQMRRGETLTFSVESSFGLPVDNRAFKGISNCYFRQNTATETAADWTMTIETLPGGFCGEEIVVMALRVICLKANAFADLVERIVRRNNHLPDIEHCGSFMLENDKFMMTNLLIEHLQNHPNCEYAGYSIPQMLTNEAKINYRTNGKQPITTIVFDAVQSIAKQANELVKRNRLEKQLAEMVLDSSHIADMSIQLKRVNVVASK